MSAPISWSATGPQALTAIPVFLHRRSAPRSAMFFSFANGLQVMIIL
jgi:hypothetical protein